MKKATFIGACKKSPFDRHAWQHTELCYEYRGHQYIVTRDNNGYMGESIPAQHLREQARIDELIARKDNPVPEWKYEGSAQEALDKFFEEMGW